MAKSFHEAMPAVRTLFAQAGSVLGFDLEKACFEGPDAWLTQTKVCQPALYVHGYAVFTALREQGKLDGGVGACLGLSLGELTALAAAGAFDFATGLGLVAERGRLMQEACEATSGTMAVIIGGEKDKVEGLCSACDVEMANLNCPGQIVISGEKAKIENAIERASSFGFKMIKPLNVAGAYHSRLMQSASQAFGQVLEKAEIRAPQVPVLTNTTGQQVRTPAEIRAALVKQVVAPVLWEDCVRSAAALGITEFYECGPGGVLAGHLKRIDRTLKVVSISEFQELPA